MDQALVAVNEKLDSLTAQVEYLTEQARLAQRRQAERSELVHDAMPIIDDAFRLTVEQLEEVQEYVDLGDLLRSLKRLLRNGRNIDKMLDQLESLTDLTQTVVPLTDSAFERATDLLQTAEERGYFAFARGGARIVDSVVTSFSEEEIRRLGENMVLILNVVKDLTQPQIMGFVHNMILEGEHAVDKPADASVLSLLRQLRDQDVRRGLAQTMRLLHVIGAHTATK